MDVLIEKGDMVLTPVGEYLYVSGIDEFLQKAILSVKIRKGSFIYNKNLGSELRGIDPESPSAVNTAELLLKEALIEVGGYRLRVVSLKGIQDNKYQATIQVEGNDEIRERVVEFIADL